MKARICLRNIQNSKNLIKYYTVKWSDLSTLNWLYLENIKTQNLFKEKTWNGIVLRNFHNSKHFS